MSRWIDVPAHRVLEIDRQDYLENYDVLNCEGQPVQFGQVTYRIIRKSDGKLFMIPRHHPASTCFEQLFYLEEI